MKKQILFALLFVGIIFTGCKDDNDPVPEPIPVNQIIGTWHLMEMEITDAPAEHSNIIGASLSPSYFYILSDILFINPDSTFIFKTNVMFELVDTYSGIYEYEDDQLTLLFDQNIDDMVYDHDVNGGTLEIEIDTQLDLSTQEEQVIIPVTTNWIYRKFE